MKEFLILIAITLIYPIYSKAEIRKFQKLKILNTSQNEISPFFSSSEDLLIFSSDKKGDYDYYAVFYSNGKVESNPIILEETDLFYGASFNTNKDDQSGQISIRDKRIYLSIKDRSNENESFDIYKSIKGKFDDWGELKLLKGFINSKYAEIEPAFSANNKRIYFSSDREGGLGGFDIWYSNYDEFEDKWSSPINFKEVNTTGDERAPFIASDGKTLFFSSNGRVDKKGGFDIYYTEINSNGISNIRTFDEPINTPKNELSIIFTKDGATSLITSDREGSFDIFKAEMEPIFYSPILLKLEAFDFKSGEEIPVRYTIISEGIDKISTKGEKSEVLIPQEYFKAKKYLELTIITNNPSYPEHSKKIRLYNGQIQKTVQISFILSEDLPLESEDISYDETDAKTKEDKSTISKSIEVKSPYIEIGSPYIEGDFLIDFEGKELRVIDSYETSSTSIKPLLNYIFFEENSSFIPRRYIQIPFINGESYSEELLSTLPNLEIYYQILNIIGYRLQNNPLAELKLTGTNSNIGKEKSNLHLSEKRAMAVKNYLVNTWQISEDRIKIEKRNLPEVASSSKTEDGIAENRRVEIEFSEPKLLSPIFNNWKILNSNPSQARINISTLFYKTEGNWELTIRYNDIILDK